MAQLQDILTDWKTSKTEVVVTLIGNTTAYGIITDDGVDQDSIVVTQPNSAETVIPKVAIASIKRKKITH